MKNLKLLKDIYESLGKRGKALLILGGIVIVIALLELLT